MSAWPPSGSRSHVWPESRRLCARCPVPGARCPVSRSGPVAWISDRLRLQGDLVERSFDRLVHKDKKVAYEAFALTSLLIKAGETEPVYRTLGKHKDEDVKLALLQVLQINQDETTFQNLSELLIHHDLTPNVAAKVNEVRSYSQLMSV